MLRAAGIPARVVVGYQGAEPNRFDDYLIVYQYNAHAWVEAWFEGEGWQRLDPTAWVAPERIEQGAEMLMRQNEQTLQDPAFAMLLDTPWLNAMRLRLDSLEYSWSRWVLSYDEATQLQFLEQLVGASRVRWLPAIMVILVVLMLSAVFFGSVFKGRHRRDPIIEVCLDFMNSFAGTRLERLPGEGAKTYFHRLAAGSPLHREALEHCAREINRLMYDASPDPKAAWVKQELGQLSQHLKLLRRQLARNIKTTQM
jgi:hypothetical protein